MNGTYSTNKPTLPDFNKMLEAVEKIRGLPAQKWMLIAPDGRIWAESDPNDLLAALFHRTTELVGNVKNCKDQINT